MIYIFILIFFIVLIFRMCVIGSNLAPWPFGGVFDNSFWRVEWRIRRKIDIAKLVLFLTTLKVYIFIESNILFAL
jgi:hypothetical protein